MRRGATEHKNVGTNADVAGFDVVTLCTTSLHDCKQWRHYVRFVA